MTDLTTAITARVNWSDERLAPVARDAQTKLLMAELQIQLADVKARVAQLLEENIQLKESLKRATNTAQEVQFKDGLYYKRDGDGPFCTACFDRQKKLVRLNRMRACKVCDGTFT